MLPILRDAILLFFACFFVRSFAGRSLLISISLLVQIRLCVLLLFSSFFFFFLKHFCLRSLLCFFSRFFFIPCVYSWKFEVQRVCIWPLPFICSKTSHTQLLWFDFLYLAACIQILGKKYYPHTIKTTEKTYRPHNFRLFYFIWYSFLFIFFLARASLSID